MSENEIVEVETIVSTEQREIEQVVDERIAELQAARAGRRRRMEYIKFAILVGIFIIVIFVIAIVRPTIFDLVVPAVMGGDAGVTAVDSSNPAESPATDAPTDNTQSLPIIAVPAGGEGGTGGQVEATAVPAQIYVVQAGDTLNSIAQQFNTTVEAIVAANNIQNPDALLVGATLTIPQPTP
jgi:LysM repeat protein